jgi:IclR family acetate operon transcriptional repressor
LGTIDNALELLGFFNETNSELSLSQLADLSNRDKATIWRYMAALQRNGFIEQDSANKAYHLGPAILRLARIREITFPTGAVANEHMSWLRDAVHETTHLSLAQGPALTTVLVIERSGGGTRVHIDPSEMAPYHLTASGLAYLAFGPKEQRDLVLSEPLVAITPYSITDPVEIYKTLEKVRASGFAISNQGFEAGVFGIAAPIFNARGNCFGAIGVATPTSRIDDETQERICLKVVETAQRISKALGGPGDNNSQPEGSG